ncbi:MAG TPA: manganese efflux pump MntP family protein [Sedimentisphaerales bacterium]|nr:manganese efflux pump MntP family protein [Sedimentisphaerales bacterium]
MNSVVIGLALGLSMDAAAVSIASGAAYRDIRARHALRMAIFFGGFQAFMPLIGWAAGSLLSDFIGAWDHWVAFALLTLVGGRMIYEAFKLEEVRKNRSGPSEMMVVLTLAVATSIDAFAVGITLPMLTNSVWLAAAIIGAVTFALSMLGVYLGKSFGHIFENRIEAFGGLVLIFIGVKTLIWHLAGW